MKVRAGLLVTCAAVALGGTLSPAGAADMATKAPAVVVPATTWWYDGFAEIGGRFDMNDPNKSNLGRFYRYEDLRPGVFGNFLFGAHRTGPDPLDLVFWGYNVGWDDQNLGVEVSNPGTYYVTFDWDETPHVYSTGARTTYSPIGGTFLTTPTYPFPPSAKTQAFVNGNSNEFDIGFRRDTASVAGRWTPDSNWDVNAGYSHLDLPGTQPGSIVMFSPPVGFGGNETRTAVQFPKPVDDTTQDGVVNAEYAGSSPWGKPFNVSFGYAVSVYNNDDKSVTVQNPWVTSDTLRHALFNTYSLWPDNQAHTMTVTSGVGLPLNSRYMGTFQYTWMLQNDSFLPSNSNSLATLATVPRSSLDGDARTILSNNVVHTQFTPYFDTNLRYRYYDYHSNQSPLFITNQVTAPDTALPANLTDETAWPVNFNKQNASAEAVYRPWSWLDLGAAYEWERWKHEYADSVDVVTGQDGNFDAVTNENAVKGYFDAKWGWSTLRTSVRFGARRLDGDYINPRDMNLDAFRTVDLEDRDSTVVKSSWAINVTDTITVTPTGGYRLDDYPANGVTTIGISNYESWNAGADIAWSITPMMAVYASYMHEDGARETFQRALPSNLVYHTQDLDDVFTLGGKVTVIPETLFLNASYTYSRGTSKWASDCGPGGCFLNPMPTYPDTHNTNQRIDAWAKYMLDPNLVRNAGFLAATKPYLKFRVIWEKNENDSWQNVEQQLGWAVNPADTTMARAIFLGMPNPNYDVVVGMVSFGLKW